MTCDLPKEDLSAYIDNELSADRKIQIETHLRECAECADERGFLDAGDRAVRALVEYATPRSFETELRRIVQTYRPQRLRWWSLGGRLQKRHAVAALCTVCGVALLALAWQLRFLVPRTPPQPPPETSAVRPVVKSVTQPPVPAVRRTIVTEEKPASREPTPPPSAPEPSPYEGWWMLSVGRPTRYQYPVRIRQQRGRLAVYAWGGSAPLGVGTEVNGRFTTDGTVGLLIDIEFSPARPEFMGIIQRRGDPAIRVLAERIGDSMADELAGTPDLLSFIERRCADARKLSRALYAYASANRERFPGALDELVPEYLPDDSLFADRAGRETVYSGAGVVPADRLVDWAQYDAEALTVEERMVLLEEQDVARFNAFFEEMVVQYRRNFPEGRTVIYLDGSVAWDGVDNVPVLLAPQLHDRIENQYERTCKSHLQELGRALLRFAEDHEGLFPTHIEMLWPTYLKDAANLCCPSYGPHDVAYEVVCLGHELPSADEVELDPEVLSTIPLAVEKEDSHRNGFHTVTADGQVTWRPAYER